jgi:preprotein translocase subunit YajC
MKKCELKRGDKVANRDGQVGVVLKIWETGQILVQHKPNVFCTYDHDWMIKKIEGGN